MYQRDTWVLIGCGVTLAVIMFLPSLVFAGIVALDICYYEPGCHVTHARMIQVVWLFLFLLSEMLYSHWDIKPKKA